MSKPAKIVFMPESILEQIQQIKKQLRLAMNGITSESMQERGLGYRVNYGVALITLRMMAGKYGKNQDLAQKLWLENVRELRILATLIQPVDSFTPAMAHEWAEDIQQPEMAEQCAMNLFQHLTFAPDLVHDWLKQSDKMLRYIAWQLLARIAVKDFQVEKSVLDFILVEAIKDIQSSHVSLFNGALLGLKRIGSNNINLARRILDDVGNVPDFQEERKQHILDDLRFEFEYKLQTAL
jgi:DNA alkylation repair enzyme.